MESLSALLALPFGTLVVLGSGYIGYRIAFVGHDGPHGPVDVIFLSLAFSAVAKATMMLSGTAPYIGSVLAVLVTVLAAIGWRTLGAPVSVDVLRRLGISDHDRGRTVWESMTHRRLKPPMRIVVDMTGGRQLMCDDTQPFDKAPLGPCLLGPDGSVALYVTSTRSSSDADWIDVTPYEAGKPGWGYDMTFVPAAAISRVRIMRPA